MEFQLNEIKKNKYNTKHHKKTFDLKNAVYDEEFASLLNSLSLYIKNFYSTTLNTIKDFDNNLLDINNYIIRSKCLINEINYNNIKEKIKKLSEQIDKISSTKKILEQNLLVVGTNMNSFYDDSKKIFKNMKKVKNNRENLAMDTSFNFEPNNSMTNLKTAFEKEDLFLSNNDSDNYYKNRNNSINNDRENRSSRSNIIFRRNNIIPLTRKRDINPRYNLKLNYYNYGLNKRRDNLHNSSSNNSFKRKNLFISNNFRKVSSSSIRDSDTNKNYKNVSKISLESSPDMSKTKSSFRSLYINPKSIINKNNDTNNILELSYKVIDFLSLLSKISNKNYSNNNPYMQSILQKFEKTRNSLFELSTKYIEQNNKQSNRGFTKGLFQNYNNQTNNKSKVRRDLQLILMNNNVTNIKKEMEYKELIEKINSLTRNINNLERENKNLINMHNNSKKELFNNTLLLYKKNDQLNLAKKENTQYIEQLNLLQKDNKALMELIYDKNNSNNNDKIQSDFEKKEQKENIVKKYNKHINSLKNKYENELRNKDNEIKKLKENIIELNNSLKYFNNMKDIIKEKDIIIDELKKNSIHNKNKNNNNEENKNKIMLSKNEFNKSDLVFEESNSFSYIIKKNKKNSIKESKPQQKTKFNFKELILEQIDSFFYEIDKKNKEDNISDIILNNNKVDELENEISKLKDEINEVNNENINLKSLLKDNKNNNNEDKINKYMEEINNLKKENNQIIEEKNNLMSDYENMLLNNKNMEVTMEEKDKQITILENNIKNLENQIKELEIKNIGNSNDYKIDNKNNFEIKISQKLKPKINKNDIDIDLDEHNEMISQLKEELKEKDNQLELLKIDCQELKSKIEEYEENFNSSSCRQNSELNERSVDEKEKIKFLTERNNYYEKLSSEYKSKIQNLEKIKKNLENENEELKNNQKSNNIINNKNEIQNTNEKDKNVYNSENYIILCDKSYGDLKWYLLANKNTNINAFNNDSNDESDNHNYDNLFWVSKNNIVDIDNFNSYQNDDQNKSEDDKFTHKINKNDINININKVKEISFSSNVNNFSFHNSDDGNKSRGNNNINNINEININPNLKRGSLFSLGNNNIISEDNNNDYNKLLEKFKIILEKLNKTEEKYLQLQKKNSELKEKIRKSNKSNSNIIKISVSDDSNNLSNNNDIGKLSLIENNFDGDNDALSKLNLNRNIREHEYYESIQIELDATKNQLTYIKQIFKELEKKFETVKQICENLFSKISLKKKEKEEFKILLKVMDFTDEKISLIIDKKKK